MQKVQQFRQEAKSSFQRADHILRITYKNIRDPKLLFSVVDGLEGAITKGIKAVLQFERVHKEIEPDTKDLNSDITLFSRHIVPKYKLNSEIINILRELQGLQKVRKESQVEFRRKDKYIICSDNYRMKKIDEKTMKDYLPGIKGFLNRVEAITNVCR